MTRTGADMTRDFDEVGSLPAHSDEIGAAIASIEVALAVLREPTIKLPLPPERLTSADRLVAFPA
jgi:hypothetical protein